ncbi:LysR family transcriptional regulator [Nisaea acidiphila]|uniref:LysR family transcriptional regulator n=1 Tax=Nisaea acidiphila TaxID=1862145 RepID=A0A9J7AMV3_9PROT|nr:LysR family transcriptional regulator [Nisaea acidiphila]UUX48494.1 LysR family transcriptional regulator [Nisaea acidiphila]
MVRKITTDWDDLRFVLAIARTGSIRGAARALAVNHGTVLQRLNHVEETLGTRLFGRTRKGMIATEAGEELVRHAAEMDISFRTATLSAAGRDAELSGPIRVSIPFALCPAGIGAVLADFSAQYPLIDIELEITDRFTRFADLEADLSVRLAFGVDDDAIGQRVLQYCKTAYAAPETCALLADSPGAVRWLGWAKEDESSGWTEETGITGLAMAHKCPEHRSQIEIARHGPYLTLLPCFLGDRQPGLVRVPGARLIADRSIWILYRSDQKTTARLRALKETLIRHFDGQRAFYSGAGAAA